MNAFFFSVGLHTNRPIDRRRIFLLPVIGGHASRRFISLAPSVIHNWRPFVGICSGPRPWPCCCGRRSAASRLRRDCLTGKRRTGPRRWSCACARRRISARCAAKAEKPGPRQWTPRRRGRGTSAVKSRWCGATRAFWASCTALTRKRTAGTFANNTFDRFVFCSLSIVFTTLKRRGRRAERVSWDLNYRTNKIHLHLHDCWFFFFFYYDRLSIFDRIWNVYAYRINPAAALETDKV